MKIVFVEPETPGNIGALARVMNNFNLKELILINPQCNIESGETRARAKHAYETVKNARILNSLDKVKEEVNHLIGSTGLIPEKYTPERTPLTPKQLKENLQNAEGEAALVLGREGTGLNNEELKKCNAVVHIPTSKEYPIMNITHAAAIILYELKNVKKRAKKEFPEKEKLEEYFNGSVDNIKGIKKPKEVKQIFKKVIDKSFIKKKEAQSLIAAFRRIENETKQQK